MAEENTKGAMNVESRGMLAADVERAVLLMPEKDVKEGTRVR